MGAQPVTVNCLDCTNGELIRDPDPDDWFCDDDVAVVCVVTSNPTRNEKSRYASARHENRCVTSGDRPYRVRTYSERPKWCPVPEKDIILKES